MNRDEKLDRKPERLPFLWKNNIVAPQDTAAGGTWIGLHPENRQWACLLNGYSDNDLKPPAKSRGDIVSTLLTDNDFTLEKIKAADYNSFRLICGNMEEIHEFFWDGHNLSHGKPNMMRGMVFRTSSSWKQKEVIKYRENVVQDWDQSYLTNANIPSFHARQDSGHEASSILMRRQNPARATTSITKIEISHDHSSMHYISAQEKNASTLSALKSGDVSDENIQTITA